MHAGRFHAGALHPFQVAAWIVDYLSVEMNTAFYGFRIVPQVVLVEIAIAVLMPQIASLLPVLQGTRISVQEALSGISQLLANK